MQLHTIGHSTRPPEEFIALLQAGGVDFLVDIRAIPRSRRNPDYNIDTLPGLLRPAGIFYSHIAALGGRRGKSKHSSPNGLWENDSFRNYADYALTPPFRDGLATLLALAADHRPAIMCAEALWWQCHRRIVTDHLLAAGCAVTHIMGPDKSEPASLTKGAVVEPDRLVLYPPAQASLF
jgi:uncharacterized protein (DUF488 family)